jgi:hypothetical protein
MAEGIIEDPVALGYPGWGSGSIRERDWTFLKKAILDYGVESICEIGIGLSTLLMQQLIPKYVGYDSLQRHIDMMVELVMPHVELRWWNGKDALHLDDYYDMAFIDGPQGAKIRFPSFKSVVHRCKLLAMHDTGYIWNDEWRFKLDPEDKYKVVMHGGGLAIWRMMD